MWFGHFTISHLDSATHEQLAIKPGDGRLGSVGVVEGNSTLPLHAAGGFVFVHPDLGALGPLVHLEAMR